MILQSFEPWVKVKANGTFIISFHFDPIKSDDGDKRAVIHNRILCQFKTIIWKFTNLKLWQRQSNAWQQQRRPGHDRADKNTCSPSLSDAKTFRRHQNPPHTFWPSRFIRSTHTHTQTFDTVTLFRLLLYPMYGRAMECAAWSRTQMYDVRIRKHTNTIYAMFETNFEHLIPYSCDIAAL